MERDDDLNKSHHALGEPIKSHTHPFFLTPDDVAGYPLPVGAECQREMVRYVAGARHLECSTQDGHVVDHAIDLRAVELDRSGSQYIETSGTAHFHTAMMVCAI